MPDIPAGRCLIPIDLLLPGAESISKVGMPSSTSQTAEDFDALADTNGSGVPELVVTGTTNDGTAKTVGKEAGDGSQLFNRKLP